MQVSVRRNVFSIFLLSFWLVGTGCTSQTVTPAQQQGNRPVSNSVDLAAVSSRLHEIADSGNLADLRWPNFTDYRLHFQHVYESSNFAPVWLSNGKPTPQALGVIQALEASKQKGLNPDDYDASRWPDRLHALDGTPTADSLARFDAALTVGAMRYISDLHIGRVNPKHFNFGIDIEANKYDLPHFVTSKVINAANVQSVLDGVEPPYNGYKATEVMLQHYLPLAAQGDGTPVPDVTKTVAPGDAYAGIPQLTQRLRLLGYLHAVNLLRPAGRRGQDLPVTPRSGRDRQDRQRHHSPAQHAPRHPRQPVAGRARALALAAATVPAAAGRRQYSRIYRARLRPESKGRVRL
jgi:murein L,D-transpeptidase YcbB/YkuD